MPKPEDVNSSRFPVLIGDVLYDDGESSLAFSKWGKDPALGIRWNERHGDSPSGQGFPNQGSYSTWFIIPRCIAVATLRGLLVTEPDPAIARKMKIAIRKLESDCHSADG
jgi:hypothetical protein